MDRPVVTTTHGKVAGEFYNGTAIFRGIPYGGPTDGDRRFLPPVPAEDWEGIRECIENGPIAYQVGGSICGQEGFGTYFSGDKPEQFHCEREIQEENCLVLNVVTPGVDDKKRPVVVYIHGGGFSSGSGSLVLGADRWAREEDIVVVGINHRLNVFGYLYLGELDEKYASSGVAGLLDCVLALEWVRDNIAFFGGDPAKVTIMGESGGGMKVTHLLAMPAAAGLFRAAIVESGSCAPAVFSRKQAVELTEKLLEKLEIPKDELSLLLTLPAQQILDAAVETGVYTEIYPCADGIFLDYNEKGDYREADPSLPLLVGASEEEIAAFADVGAHMTWESLPKKLGEPIPGLEELTGEPFQEEQAEKVIAVFRAMDTKNVDAQHLFFRIHSMKGILGAGAYEQALAKAQKGQGAVYHYFVTYDAPHPFDPRKRFAWHTADLPLQMRLVAYPECEKLSRIMAHAWAAFIRTGSPDTPRLPWPAFTVSKQQVMVFDDVCSLQTDPTKPYREVF